MQIFAVILRYIISNNNRKVEMSGKKVEMSGEKYRG